MGYVLFGSGMLSWQTHCLRLWIAKWFHQLDAIGMVSSTLESLRFCKSTSNQSISKHTKNATRRQKAKTSCGAPCWHHWWHRGVEPHPWCSLHLSSEMLNSSARGTIDRLPHVRQNVKPSAQTMLANLFPKNIFDEWQMCLFWTTYSHVRTYVHTFIAFNNIYNII